MPSLVRTKGGICFHIAVTCNEREVMTLANPLQQYLSVRFTCVYLPDLKITDSKLCTGKNHFRLIVAWCNQAFSFPLLLPYSAAQC
jgi:hypothetical protein